MFKKIKKDFTLIHLLLIPLGVAIGVVGYQLSTILKLPVFLDLIGTCLVGFIAGPWIALATGVLASFVNGMLNPTAIPFAIVSGSIGFTVGMLSRHGMFKTPFKFFISCSIVTLVGTVTSTPIVVIMFGGVTGSITDVLTAVLVTSGQNIWNAVFSQNFIVSIYNNFLNIIIAWFIVRRISARYLSKTNYGHMYIKKRKEYSLDD